MEWCKRFYLGDFCLHILILKSWLEANMKYSKRVCIRMDLIEFLGSFEQKKKKRECKRNRNGKRSNYPLYLKEEEEL